ncbi:patatin-like phospholipase family protein [Flavivirga aquimarina]|uniref:Patatin-like phospholipase family protein n=1 Tax=Flavivirga aquimarina TaxID=2027862 RepID=A0ABT8WBH8_9FLAO|nr:patatin-like phospholipase family protein [Flavivirga aquimarina]MDO5970506.1 patatin-like phospholipase family protein [Flavivirga aquimarina]
MQLVNNTRNVILSGGGSKGVSHLGAIQRLEKSKRISHVKHWGGTSAGSILAYNKAIGVPTETLSIFSGVRLSSIKIDKELEKITPISLRNIVKQSKKPKYLPSNMIDLAINAILYGRLLGGDPLHMGEAQDNDHPIVKIQIELLSAYKEMVFKRRKEAEELVGKPKTKKLFEQLEEVESMTMEQWSGLLDMLGESEMIKLGLGHFTTTATVVNEKEMRPITFTSMKGSTFYEAHKKVPMIKAMAASASFPWALPPVRLKALGINCIDGGIFQNLPYIPEIFGKENTLLLHLGNKKVQDAWDSEVFHNFGTLNKFAIQSLFKRELIVGEEYASCVNGFKINPNMTLVGLNEKVTSEGIDPITTLLGEPTPQQLRDSYNEAYKFIEKYLELGRFDSNGDIIVEFAGTPYGDLMGKLKDLD